MQRLYNAKMKVGAKAYNWRTRQPSLWHREPVEDAEAFCRRALDEAFESWGMFLRQEWYDDSLQELIFVLYRLERRYDPERTDSFGKYARAVIRQRAVDVGPRRVLGRNGTRIHDYVFDDIYEVAEGTGFGWAEPERGSDQDSAGGRPSRWAQPEYARKRAWALQLLGIGSDGGTPERT